MSGKHNDKVTADGGDVRVPWEEGEARDLREHPALHRAILDNAGYAIIATDPEGVITLFNHAAERMLGYRGDETIGKLTPAVFHLDEEVAARAAAFGEELGIGLKPGFDVFVERARRGLPNEFEWTYLRKDGSRFPVLLSVTVLYDERGDISGYLGVAADLSARKAAEAAVIDGREQLNEAQRIAKVGSWTLDLTSNRLEWSDEIFRLFEIDPARFGASYEAFLEAIHPDDRDKVNRAYTDSLANRQPYSIVHRLRFDDGRVKWVEERCETLFDDDGAPLLSRGTVQDITKQYEADEAVRLYASVFEHSGEAMLITDAENRIVALNQAFTDQTGYSLEDLRGENPRVLASGRTEPETYREMWSHLNERGFWHGELCDRRKDGEVYPKWIAISVVRNAEGAVTHYVASFTDISERKAAEARMYRLAHYDVLTGLFNRFSLEDRLEQSLAAARREDRQLAVLFLDMDRFKIINDTVGHHAGDALLIEVAARLKANVRESDIVARLGGDEFVVVLTGLDHGLLNAAQVAAKVVDALGRPYEVEGNSLNSSPSIGIALFPADGEDAETLMKNADTAMYHVKETGRNGSQFFAAGMNAAVEERLALEKALRQALEREEFVLHYQPQIRAVGGGVIGVEALVRWRHPERGLVYPDQFIPLAEEVGLIGALGDWVLFEACRQRAEWRDAGIEGVRMAVNLSLHQLSDPAFIGRVERAIEVHRLRPGDLELEITESQAMSDPESTINQLTALRDLGVELAIDDFGTGYSSLAYLKRLPIQTLKLDRSFVKDTPGDANDAAISAAAVSLAHTLGLTVVAEGVETEEQEAFLVAHRCDYLQGYRFSKPLPADEVLETVRAGRFPSD